MTQARGGVRVLLSVKTACITVRPFTGNCHYPVY